MSDRTVGRNSIQEGRVVEWTLPGTENRYWRVFQGLYKQMDAERDGVIFQQDGAASHWSKLTKKWFSDHEILLPFHLVTFPDLSPIELVFAGPVQSSFLPPKWATMDCNQSRTDPDIEGTKPNHLGPVFCSPWCQLRPIQTCFFAYNLLYQYKPSVSQLLLLLKIQGLYSIVKLVNTCDYTKF